VGSVPALRFTNSVKQLTESEYITRLLGSYPEREQEASLEAMALVEDAVAAFPISSKLWCIRGDLIQLSTVKAEYELEDALRSYERAASVEPECAEAYEGMGYFYDVVISDPASAEDPFQKAIEMGAGADSYCGLARVLAELNREEEALSLLTPRRCPYAEAPEIVKIREEIKTGMWSDRSSAD
jgi:tetratricopeptide (TPR) repeat protein